MTRAKGPLTRREWEVLEQAARGLSLIESAAESHHAEQTIKFHRQSIIRKLGAQNTAHAVGLAYERGILRLGRMHREPVRDAGPDRLEWMARAWHDHFGHDEHFGPWETCEANVCVEARRELGLEKPEPVNPHRS